MNDLNQDDLDAFEDRLTRLLHSEAASTEVPSELHTMLERTTLQYSPDDSKAWIFFGLFLVVALGAAGLAFWTPLLLAGGAGGVVLGVAVDRRLRRLEGRTLVDAVRSAMRA